MSIILYSFCLLTVTYYFFSPYLPVCCLLDSNIVPILCVFLLYNLLSFWRMPSSGMWRCVDLVWTDVSEERLFTQDLHGVRSKKTAFFIVTAVKTLNLTYNLSVNWSLIHVKPILYTSISSVLDIYVSGQLSSVCSATSFREHKEQLPLSVPPLNPLSFQIPAFIHAIRHLLYLHYQDVFLQDSCRCKQLWQF
jgi:hypothetical protein